MVLCCLFLVSRVSVTFHLMCVHIVFSSVSVAEWPPFGRWLPARLAVCSLCVLAVCGVGCFPFWFWGLGFGSGCFGSWSLRALCFWYKLVTERKSSGQ